MDAGREARCEQAEAGGPLELFPPWAVARVAEALCEAGALRTVVRMALVHTSWREPVREAWARHVLDVTGAGAAVDALYERGGHCGPPADCARVGERGRELSDDGLHISHRQASTTCGADCLSSLSSRQPQLWHLLLLRATAASIAANAGHLRWAVAVAPPTARRDGGRAPVRVEGVLKRCSLGGASVELEYAFPGWHELAARERTESEGADARTPLCLPGAPPAGDLRMPAWLADELPTRAPMPWCGYPARATTLANASLHCSDEALSAVEVTAMAFGALEYCASPGSEFNLRQAHVRGVWFEPPDADGGDLRATVYLHANECLPRATDCDERARVETERVRELMELPAAAPGVSKSSHSLLCSGAALGAFSRALCLTLDAWGVDGDHRASFFLSLATSDCDICGWGSDGEHARWRHAAAVGSFARLCGTAHSEAGEARTSPVMSWPTSATQPRSAGDTSGWARGSEQGFASQLPFARVPVTCDGGTEYELVEGEGVWSLLCQLMDSATYFDLAVFKEGVAGPVLCRSRCECWSRSHEYTRYTMDKTRLRDTFVHCSRTTDAEIVREFSLPFIPGDDWGVLFDPHEPTCDAWAARALQNNALDLIEYRTRESGSDESSTRYGVLLRLEAR